MKYTQDERAGTVCILGAGILWGTVGLFIRQLNACGATPELMSFLRVLFAGGIMAAFGMIRSGFGCFRIRKRTLAACALLGLLCHGIYNVLRSFAVLYAGVAVSTVLQNIAPVVTLLCSSRLFGEQITSKKCIAIILCILGCTFTAVNSSSNAASHLLMGVLFSLGAGTCYGLTAIFSRLVDEREDPVTVSIYSYFFAALFLGIRLRPWQGIPAVSGEMMGWSILYALIPTASAYLLYYRGVQVMRETSKVPVLASSETIVAVLIGSLAFREGLGIVQILGISLVLSAIVIMNTKRKRRIPA